MASYVLDDFLGAGVLKDMGRIFAEDGWDDVPTLKVIGAEDMEALDLTDAQRDALELRIYLHNRSLMKYADRMEASRIGLIDLMSKKPAELASKFKMRKSHVATFVDTTITCGIRMPPNLPRVSSIRRLSSSTASRPSQDATLGPCIILPKAKPIYKSPPFEPHKSTLSDTSSPRTPPRKSNAGLDLGSYAKNSPPPKSSAGELGFKNSYAKYSPSRRSNAGGLAYFENACARNSPPRKSNAGELGSRNAYAKNSPPRKSNAGGLAYFENACARNSPPRKSNAGELGYRNAYAKNSPPRKSNAGGLAYFENACARNSPPRKSNAGELGSRNAYAKNSPPRKSNAGGLAYFENACARNSPPRKSNAGELGSRNAYAKNSPPRKSNAGGLAYFENACARNSPPRKSNAGELGSRNAYAKNSPPRKSNAGGLAYFENACARNSPPRKSNAGELGFRNAYARNSPPRKSNAGELGFRNAYAKNSLPRKSNAGGLGFNGHTFALNSPRKSNAEDLGFNGNSCARSSPPRRSNAVELGFEQLSWVRSVDATKPNAFKGVFSSTSTKRQLCGMVKAPSSDKVAKISVLEKVSLRQLAPEHNYRVDSRTLKGSTRLPPFKASNLWSDRATLFFCIRRPGCVMCRAEAHQLFARKPIFDALGIQLVAVLLEDIDEEVWAFWPRYWAGMVVLDEKRDFFRALGGGKLMKDSLFTGFLLNPIARLNWKRAIKFGIRYTMKGEGTIKGGMFIVRRGKGGVVYQFAERNFGDWAPLDEVLQVCHVIREEGDCAG